MMIQSQITLLIHILFFSLCINLVFAKTRCLKEEREALLNFKHGVVDHYGRLSSWSNETDCCNWIGVGCSNWTDHVLMVDLPGRWPTRMDYVGLKGNISSSLLKLPELNYLDLSFNRFDSNIPEFIGSLHNLQYLDLSGAFPSIGSVPSEFGNLTKLRHLDLSQNHGTKIEKIEWLSNLLLLKHLDLSEMDLSGLANWANGIDMLPSLVELNLQFTKLPNVSATSLPSLNSSKSLAVVDLTGNQLSSSIYTWLFKFSASLTEINLSVNKLCGAVPSAFTNFSILRSLDFTSNCLSEELPMFFNKLPSKSLENLRLMANDLTGSVPDLTRFSSLRELSIAKNKLDGTFPRSFRQMSSLIFLDLSDNQISGSLPDLAVFSSLKELFLMENLLNGTLTKSIGHIFKLEVLDISSNFLEGIISEAHFSNLSKLQNLDLSYNSLSLDVSSEWVPTFQLNSLRLSSCNLGLGFPKWIHTQKNLSLLDISATGISDTVPNWFWDSSSNLRDLNLSHNQIHGMLPDLSSKLGSSPRLDLSFNFFSGPIPLVPFNVSLLDLSNNMFSGSINSFLCRIITRHLIILDLSNNVLSQNLPDCWMRVEQLGFLSLANNQFTGILPNSIGSLASVQMMTMRNNSIFGELPSSLKNCTSLKLLDLGGNRLSGEIPGWLGESLSELVVISFWSNDFHGNLPSTLCNMAYIQVLDLSVNNISGTIPSCIRNFTAMVQREGIGASISFSYPEYSRVLSFGHIINYPGRTVIFNALLEWKGRRSEYRNTLGLVKIIDLSSNKLTGEIPDEITTLVGLVALNLSRNSFTGTISPNIGQLRWLDFLDLSTNKLSGQIPTSLAQLSNLAVLNLSRNNLSGRIPSSTQLQSFSASAYAGNPKLCGAPLAKSCNGDGAPPDPTVTGDDNEEGGSEDKFITIGFYVSLVLGFASGFWAFFGTLLLKDKWRFTYFRSMNTILDWIYVIITLKIARLRRRT